MGRSAAQPSANAARAAGAQPQGKTDARGATAPMAAPPPARRWVSGHIREQSPPVAAEVKPSTAGGYGRPPSVAASSGVGATGAARVTQPRSSFYGALPGLAASTPVVTGQAARPHVGPAAASGESAKRTAPVTRNGWAPSLYKSAPRSGLAGDSALAPLALGSSTAAVARKVRPSFYEGQIVTVAAPAARTEASVAPLAAHDGDAISRPSRGADREVGLALEGAGGEQSAAGGGEQLVAPGTETCAAAADPVADVGSQAMQVLSSAEPVADVEEARDPSGGELPEAPASVGGTTTPAADDDVAAPGGGVADDSAQIEAAAPAAEEVCSSSASLPPSPAPVDAADANCAISDVCSTASCSDNTASAAAVIAVAGAFSATQVDEALRPPAVLDWYRCSRGRRWVDLLEDSDYEELEHVANKWLAKCAAASSGARAGAADVASIDASTMCSDSPEAGSATLEVEDAPSAAASAWPWAAASRGGNRASSSSRLVWKPKSQAVCASDEAAWSQSQAPGRRRRRRR